MSQPFWLPYQLYTKNIVLVYCIGNSEVLECFRQENITVTWKPYIAESCLIFVKKNIVAYAKTKFVKQKYGSMQFFALCSTTQLRALALNTLLQFSKSGIIFLPYTPVKILPCASISLS